MEPTTSPLQNKKVLIIAGLVIVLILFISVVAISGKKSPQPTPTPGNQSIQPTAVTVPHPNTYLSKPLPSKLISQLTVKGQVDLIKRYFIYKDALTENNIQFPTIDENSFDAVSRAEPQMYKLVLANLVSQADFVYIKARFRLYPTDQIEAQMNKDVPDLQAKAKELIDKYHDKFAGDIINVQQILNESNTDPDLTQINYKDKNEFIRGFTTDHMLFVDPGFNAFLFSQQRGKVSDVYPLKQDGKPYAYLIVYPTSLTNNKYSTIDEVLNSKMGNFK